MQKLVLISSIFLAVVFSGAGCRHFTSHFDSGIKGSGLRKTEKRELQPFKTIDVSGVYETEITCQKPASFEIEADDNILPLIKTEVRDGTLFVSNDQRYSSARAVSLRISLPELMRVATRGAGTVNIAGFNGETLSLESTGAASVTAAGKAKSLDVSSTGAGDIEAANLTAEKVSVRVTGAASVAVFASDQLDVTVAGAGSVKYSGNPKTVNKSVSGFGSVSKQESQ
jgi:hypothetical protein